MSFVVRNVPPGLKNAPGHNRSWLSAANNWRLNWQSVGVTS